jgi:hypothetical protein
VSTKSEVDARTAEIEALRARVAELEHELAEQTRRTAHLVADAQEKLYWLERWGVDLDRAMRVPGAMLLLQVARRARGVVWALKRLRRRMRGR